MNYIISPEFTLQKHKLQKEAPGLAQTRKGMGNVNMNKWGQRCLHCHRSFETDKGFVEYVSE